MATDIKKAVAPNGLTESLQVEQRAQEADIGIIHLIDKNTKEPNTKTPLRGNSGGGGTRRWDL